MVPGGTEMGGGVPIHCDTGPSCKSGPAGFKAGQAFTAVYNRASRFYSRPARFKTGRPAIKPAAGFQAGQVYNRALTYVYIYIYNYI